MSVSVELLDKVKLYVSARSGAIDTTTPEFEMLVDIAYDKYAGVRTCDSYYMILGLYALHLNEIKLMADGTGNSLTGPVSSKREGDLSVGIDSNYGASSSNSDLGRTGWGIELQEQIRRCVPFTATNCNM